MAVTELAGTWVFNDRLFGGNLELLDIEFIFNFDSSNSHFTSLGISQNTRPDNEILYMAFGDLGQVYSTQHFDDDDTTSNRWRNDAYKTITITSKLSEVTDGETLLAWLQSNATKQSNKLSVDLTTLSGWANLAPGNHTIKIVAKGTGYRDSEKSAGVEVTKPAEVYTDCLTFTGETSEFTLKPQYRKVWDGTLYYSTDHNTWNVWNGEEISSANKKLYLKGKGNTKFRIYDDNAEDFYYAEFRLSAKAECSGNIQTLLDWENPPTSIPADDCFNKMFFGCTNLTIAPELPAITLATHCYDSMFGNCTNLTTAPDLPATTLAGSCYSSMFLGCTRLTIAPELPATTLAQYCYSNMFRGCTNLITAPVLPATTLANYCYGYMFQGCSKLKVNASSGNKIFTCPSTIPNMAVTNMFTNTGGSFTGTPTAGNTYYWTE